MPRYPNAFFDRPISELFGDGPCVLSWIPVALRASIYAGTCATDVSPYIQNAHDDLAPGQSLFCPAGVYPLAGAGDAIITISKNITLRGDHNQGTVFLVLAGVPNTRDVFRLQGTLEGLVLRDFSIRGQLGPPVPIMAVTNASPMVVHAPGHPFSSGQIICQSGILNVGGVESSADGKHLVTVIDADHYSLSNADANGPALSTPNGVYDSGGVAQTLPARHGLAFDITDPIQDCVIDHVASYSGPIGNNLGGYTLCTLPSAPPSLNGNFFLNRISHYQFGDGAFFDSAGDSNVVVNGHTPGDTLGIWIKLAYGANSFFVQCQNSTGRRGALAVIRGDTVTVSLPNMELGGPTAYPMPAVVTLGYQRDGLIAVDVTAAAWSAVTAYVVGDMVTDTGFVWTARIANTNKQPSLNFAEWIPGILDSAAPQTFLLTDVTGIAPGSYVRFFQPLQGIYPFYDAYVSAVVGLTITAVLGIPFTSGPNNPVKIVNTRVSQPTVIGGQIVTDRPAVPNALVFDYCDDGFATAIRLSIGFGPSTEAMLLCTEHASGCEATRSVRTEIPNFPGRLFEDRADPNQASPNVLGLSPQGVPNSGAQRGPAGVIQATGFTSVSRGGFGLLQNLLYPSSAYESPNWAKLDCTITSTMAQAPDGSATARVLTEGNDSGTPALHACSFGQAKAAAFIDYTFAVWVKAINRTSCRLTLYSTLGGAASAEFDLASSKQPNGFAAGNGGAAVGWSLCKAYQEVDPDRRGWHLCVLTARSDNDTAVNCFVAAEAPLGTFEYAGTGLDSIALWHATLQETRDLGPIIATNAANVGSPGAPLEGLAVNGLILVPLADGVARMTGGELVTEAQVQTAEGGTGGNYVNFAALVTAIKAALGLGISDIAGLAAALAAKADAGSTTSGPSSGPAHTHTI